jgi:hypothetical protein
MAVTLIVESRGNPLMVELCSSDAKPVAVALGGLPRPAYRHVTCRQTILCAVDQLAAEGVAEFTVAQVHEQILAATDRFSLSTVRKTLGEMMVGFAGSDHGHGRPFVRVSRGRFRVQSSNRL